MAVDIPTSEAPAPRGLFKRNFLHSVQRRMGYKKSKGKTDEPVSKYVDDTTIASGTDDIKADAPVGEPVVEASSVVEVTIEAEVTADYPAVEEAEPGSVENTPSVAMSGPVATIVQLEPEPEAAEVGEQNEQADYGPTPEPVA
eukprot:scaffold25857_cov101-Isochrysis_galbana.AAC.1